MIEPAWISQEECLAFHSMLVANFGGADGIGDEGKLLAALERPKNQYHYEEADILKLAATYASGIVKSHPFLDGNKRNALMVCQIFIESNGHRFNATEEEAAVQILALANSRLSDEELTAWLKANCKERTS